MKFNIFLVFALIVLSIALVSAQAPQCGAFEKFKQCASSCEPACDQPDSKMCDKKCNPPKCQCMKGMVRSKEGKCILRADC
uniref:TIL domain-containing protein n=1 Tax=Panagrolaimus superbus TaxID=310955 RepID=A0A914YM97_9BILA